MPDFNPTMYFLARHEDEMAAKKAAKSDFMQVVAAVVDPSNFAVIQKQLHFIDKLGQHDPLLMAEDAWQRLAERIDAINAGELAGKLSELAEFFNAKAWQPVFDDFFAHAGDLNSMKPAHAERIKQVKEKTIELDNLLSSPDHGGAIGIYEQSVFDSTVNKTTHRIISQGAAAKVKDAVSAWADFSLALERHMAGESITPLSHTAQHRSKDSPFVRLPPDVVKFMQLRDPFGRG